jgi:hypothetical protein
MKRNPFFYLAILFISITQLSAQDLYLGSGSVLFFSAPIFSVKSNLDLQNTNGITGTGTVRFTGSTQSISGAGTLPNLIINSGSTTSIPSGSNIRLTNTLTVDGNLTIVSGGALTLNGSATAPGRVGASTGTITGNITAELAIPSGKRAFRLISHPFSSSIAISQFKDNIHVTGSGGNANGFDSTFNNSPSAFSFSESTFTGAANSGWTGFTNITNTLAPYQALRILYRGPRNQANVLTTQNATANAGTIDYTGPVNQGTVNVPMTFTAANGVNAGWNLIPNPYPSNIDIGTIVGENRNYISTFSTWVPQNGTKGAYVSGSFGSAYILRSGASFFVKTSSAASFTFSESNKTATAPTAVLLKTDPFKQNALQINLTSDDTIFWDQYVLRDRANAEEYLDILDGEKLENPDVNFYGLTSKAEKLAIDNRKIGMDSRVDLGITTSSDYHFTFEIAHIDMPQYQVVLIDKYLNKELVLEANKKYDFVTDASPLSKGAERFQLLFSSKANGLTEIKAQKVFSIYSNPVNQSLKLVSNVQSNAKNYSYTITNLLGQSVNKGQIEFESNGTIKSIDLSDMSTGVFFISIESDKSLETIKFIKN